MKKQYCKFHPLEAASYFCESCDQHTCKTCSNEGDVHQPVTQCFTCGQPLESLGATHTAVPFWRNLESIFKYGIHPQALIAIGIAVGLSLLSLVMPFLILLYAAFITKYCFSCLERTAQGQMTAVDFTKAYSGGFKLMFQVFGIILTAIIAIMLTNQFIGTGLAVLLGLLALLAFPASMIILAIEEDLKEAVNPLNLLQLILKIGPGYLLLIVFLIIMMSSTEALLYFIDDSYAMTKIILGAIATSYYSIVMYHLMGYVIFQYQGNIGFVAEEEHGPKHHRTDDQLITAEVSVLVKSGNYKKAISRYEYWLKQHPNSPRIEDDYFKLLLNMNDQEATFVYADKYLHKLLEQNNDLKAIHIIKQLLARYKAYKPFQAGLRIRAANALTEAEEYKISAALLKDFHKDFLNNKSGIIEAYELMVKVLGNFPNMKKQQDMYQHFVTVTKSKMPKEPDRKRQVY